MHKAKAAAEQLPGALEALPGNANAALHARGALAARAEGMGELARAQAQRAQRGLTSLAGLGGKLVLGTSDLFDKVRWVGCAGLCGVVGVCQQSVLRVLGLPVLHVPGPPGLPAGFRQLAVFPALPDARILHGAAATALLVQPCHPNRDVGGGWRGPRRRQRRCSAGRLCQGSRWAGQV